MNGGQAVLAQLMNKGSIGHRKSGQNWNGVRHSLLIECPHYT